MKKIKFIPVFLLVFISCQGRLPQKEEKIEEVPVEIVVSEEKSDEVKEEPQIEIEVPKEEEEKIEIAEVKKEIIEEKPQEKIEIIKEEPVIKETKEEPKPEIVEEDPTEEEYKRSVGNIEISKDTFLEDKAKILGTIDELSTIMKDKNYKAWLNYLNKSSIAYWSTPANLKKAQARLPIKGIQLKTLEDYFKFVFIPARQNRSVTEIRYISDNYTKAIEVKDDTDYVFYYFNKIDDKWVIYLPPLENR